MAIATETKTFFLSEEDEELGNEEGNSEEVDNPEKEPDEMSIDNDE
ncbi:MAG: hypothetical protein AAB884_00990 [Patescibacteria group bacterium]